MSLDDALAAGQPDETQAEDAMFALQPEVIAFEREEGGDVLHYVAYPLVQQIITAGAKGQLGELSMLSDQIKGQL